MLAEFPADGQGIRDFKQRYQGSFGFYSVPETGKRLMVQIARITDDEASFIDARGIIYTARGGKGVVFEFIPTERKVFVYNDRLLFIRRKPAKQWSRGINPGNTMVFDLTHPRAGENPWIVGLSFSVLAAAYSDDPGDPVEQLACVSAGLATSVAFSDQFGVTENSLYLYDQAIGVMLPESKKIRLAQDIFRQEVMDMLARLNIQYQVE